jgi:putative FmdB family regulatory protein
MDILPDVRSTLAAEAPESFHLCNQPARGGTEMPIYEYGCASCGAELEVWQKISEKPRRKCPDCGAMKLERLISNTSFHLKGTGWYVTDYAKKDKSKSSQSTESGKGKKASSSGDKDSTGSGSSEKKSSATKD